MRISKIVSLIQGHTLLDIGTDHAYVLIRALEAKKIDHGIAVEIREKPLKRAITNVKKHHLSDQVTFILSNGFENVDIPYDIVSITGLGFDTIKSILLQPHKIPNYYVLSSHSKVDDLRAFLSRNGFFIADEHLVYDKRYYSIIIAKKGVKPLSEADILLSPILRYQRSSLPFYQLQLKQLNNIINKMKNVDIQTKKKKEIYEKVIKYLSSIDK